MIPQPDFADYRQWISKERSITREMRSTSKAERILGVSDSTAVTTLENNRKRLKKMGNSIYFSFSDLRDVLPAFHKKGRGPYLPPRFSDSESTTSTPSPTFDPTASTSTLPSTYSSPLTKQINPTHFQEYNSSKDCLTANPPRLQKHTNTNLPHLKGFIENKRNAPGESPRSHSSNASQSEHLSPVSWKRPVPIATLHEMESSARGRWLGRKPSFLSSRDNLLQHATLARRPSKLVAEKAERHVQEWLDHADLNRSPSTSSQPFARPFSPFDRNAFSPTSSITSLRTLTSQSEQKDVDPHRSQWPLPAENLAISECASSIVPKRRRLHRSDLQIESILSFSSDEGSDDENDEKDESKPSDHCRFSQSSVNTAIRLDETEETKFTHSREKSSSVSSSIIQLDPHLAHKDKQPPVTRRFPRRTLADIAVAGAGRKRYPFFANDWQQNDMTELSASVLTETGDGFTSASELYTSPPATLGQFTISPPKSQPSLSSCFDVETLSSQEPSYERLSFAETVGDEGFEKEEDEACYEIVDIPRFPAPPHPRSNSIPKIEIEMIHDRRLEQQHQSCVQQYSGAHAVLLTPSTALRANSITSSQSTVSTKSSEDELSQRFYESNVVDFASVAGNKQTLLSRKRTISNVPIYVTGLEDLGEGAESDGNNVATFVFSNLY